MSEILLHEIDAAVVTFDLRGFSAIASGLPLVDLGIALSRFYEHAERCIEAAGGRMVKLVGDSVLAVWLGPDHDEALEAVRHAVAERGGFVADNRGAGLVDLDYVVTAAAGMVLAGQIGARHFSAFDVIGVPVNVAFKLVNEATRRGVDHLVAFAGAGTQEVEGIDLIGQRLALHRLKP